MRARHISLLIAALGLALIAGVVAFEMRPREAELASPIAGIGGPFTLTDMNGQGFDSASLMGKPWVIFFGFTHCPEVCPTTLSDLSQAYAQLGDKAKDLRAVFVTVDPERDTAAVLKDYMASFGPRMVALTGSAPEIAKVAKLFRVFYEKRPTSDGSYTMDHTALVYLMDSQSRFVGTLDFEEDTATKVKKLENLLTR